MDMEELVKKFARGLVIGTVVGLGILSVRGCLNATGPERIYAGDINGYKVEYRGRLWGNKNLRKYEMKLSKDGVTYDLEDSSDAKDLYEPNAVLESVRIKGENGSTRVYERMWLNGKTNKSDNFSSVSQRKEILDSTNRTYNQIRQQIAERITAENSKLAGALSN